jgi:hypothetical protein
MTTSVFVDEAMQISRHASRAEAANTEQDAIQAGLQRGANEELQYGSVLDFTGQPVAQRKPAKFMSANHGTKLRVSFQSQKEAPRRRTKRRRKKKTAAVSKTSSSTQDVTASVHVLQCPAQNMMEAWQGNNCFGDSVITYLQRRITSTMESADAATSAQSKIQNMCSESGEYRDALHLLHALNYR